MTCKECPICMDDIMDTNSVVTECGHCFHTSCLMKNVAHNGFGCPYCRSVLAEVPEDEDEDEDEEEEEEEEEEDEDELYSESSLTSMRMLFQRVQNEQVEEEEEQVEEEEPRPRPSAGVIEQRLLEQGVTMLDMIKCMLAINHDEYDSEDDFQTKEDEIFSKISVIISDYRNPVLQEPLLEPVEPIEPVLEPVEPVLESLEPVLIQEPVPVEPVEPVQRLIPFPYWSEILIDEEMDFKSQQKERTKRNHRQQYIREENDHIEIVIVA